eukprot:2527209-Pyramimonas_sp.AAC.1
MHQVRPSTAVVASPRWRTNQTQGAWVYSHDGPIRYMKRGYIFSRQTHHTHLGEALDGSGKGAERPLRVGAEGGRGYVTQHAPRQGQVAACLQGQVALT